MRVHVQVVIAVIRSRRSSPGKKRVWRITPDAPSGAYVDLDAKRPATQRPLAQQESGYLMSSLDLITGVDINEADESVSAELMAKYFEVRRS